MTHFPIKTLVIVGLLAASLSHAPACAQKLGEVPKVAPKDSAPRGETLEWTSAAGQPYWYRLPDPKRAKRPPHLILMLHGTGMNHGWAFWNYSVQGGQFRPDDIVVSPEGVTPGAGSTFNFLQGKPDGEQLASIIRQFKEAFPVDRVYVYGHSQGAFFCYWFAGEYPELVDAIVAHAGNVLAVQYPKVAKDHQAIAILHGEVDQVVSVECAHRTHRIYSEQGYKKLRLEVVKDLRPEAGHWPLPDSVKQLLTWCDQVTTKEPGALLDIITAQRAADQPDLAVLVESLESAKTLLKAYKGADKDVLKTRVTNLSTAVDDAIVAMGNQLGEEADKRKPAYGPWAPFVREAHRVFESHPGFKKAFGPWAAQAKKDSQTLAKALAAVERDPEKAFGGGATAARDAFLGSPYETLVSALGRTAARADAKIKDKDRDAFQSLVKEREEAESKGRDLRIAMAKKILELWNE